LHPPPRGPGPAPAQDRFVLKKKNPWVTVLNLGAFLAGATAGYWFCRLEREFTSYGEGLMLKALKMMRREPEGRPEHARTTRFSHVDDDSSDPLSEGTDFGSEDEV